MTSRITYTKATYHSHAVLSTIPSLPDYSSALPAHIPTQYRSKARVLSIIRSPNVRRWQIDKHALFFSVDEDELAIRHCDRNAAREGNG